MSELRQILNIGQILRAHGLLGEVKVLPLTGDSGRFKLLKECLLMAADQKAFTRICVEYVKVLPNQLILKLQGIDDRDRAEAVRGRLLAVRREDAVLLPKDCWFICDLLGCTVYDDSEGYLGELTDVIESSAQDVYVVSLSGQPDLLFPALKSILQKVDIHARRIDIRLTDGLYEVYRGRKS